MLEALCPPRTADRLRYTNTDRQHELVGLSNVSTACQGNPLYSETSILLGKLLTPKGSVNVGTVRSGLLPVSGG